MSGGGHVVVEEEREPFVGAETAGNEMATGTHEPPQVPRLGGAQGRSVEDDERRRRVERPRYQVAPEPVGGVAEAGEELGVGGQSVLLGGVGRRRGPPGAASPAGEE